MEKYHIQMIILSNIPPQYLSYYLFVSVKNSAYNEFIFYLTVTYGYSDNTYRWKKNKHLRCL